MLPPVNRRSTAGPGPTFQPTIHPYPTPPRCGAPPEGPGKSGLRTARAHIDRSIDREGAVGEFEGLLLILLFLSKAGGSFALQEDQQEEGVPFRNVLEMSSFQTKIIISPGRP